jgi:hypothetical protein
MLPKGFHLDFEPALNNAIANVFPGAAIMNDFFHLVQANVKKARWLRIERNEIRELVHDLNKLWYKATKGEFDVCLQEFLSNWER